MCSVNVSLHYFCERGKIYIFTRSLAGVLLWLRSASQGDETCVRARYDTVLKIHCCVLIMESLNTSDLGTVRSAIIASGWFSQTRSHIAIT